MVEEKFKKQLEGKSYAGYSKIAKSVTKSIVKGAEESITSKGKLSYKKDNPLKKLLKVNRPIVKVSGTKERINLMRATW